MKSFLAMSAMVPLLLLILVLALINSTFMSVVDEIGDRDDGEADA